MEEKREEKKKKREEEQLTAKVRERVVSLMQANKARSLALHSPHFTVHVGLSNQFPAQWLILRY